MQKKKKRKIEKSTAFSIAWDFTICQIISRCPGQHNEKLYAMPARQQYIHCTFAQVISESSHWVNIIAQLRTYIQWMASFCLSTLALHSQTCICTLSTIPRNRNGLGCCFPAENNTLNPKSFCMHKQSCLRAQCSKQMCLPAQNCMCTNLAWSPSKNPV